MDNFVKILRNANTPATGVSSEDTYDNGAGFFAPLSWQFEEEGEYTPNEKTFPSVDLPLSYKADSKKEEEIPKAPDFDTYVDKINRMQSEVDSLPDGFVKDLARKMLKERANELINEHLFDD